MAAYTKSLVFHDRGAPPSLDPKPVEPTESEPKTKPEPKGTVQTKNEEAVTSK